MKTENRGARSARTSLILVTFSGVLALAGACSSNDDNPTPNTGGTRTQGGSSATGGSAGKSSGGTATSGGASQTGGNGGASDTGGTDVGGEPGTGGTAGSGDGGGGANGGGDVGGGGAGGAGPDNTCPATDLEFLNRPNTSQCSKFPNTKARLPLLNADGSLPPLPGS
ncbi:MAG TPA: hypothetical protein VG937_17570 [Polyangiaceae bacterium]|jgi:hypothetical protein|nr:hypothetical protein [Polyangiaceae bacterium]